MKTLSKEKAKRIAAMARRYDVPGLLDMGFFSVDYWREEVKLMGREERMGFRPGGGCRIDEDAAYEYRTVTLPGKVVVKITIVTRYKNCND